MGLTKDIGDVKLSIQLHTTESMDVLIEGKKPIFHFVLDREKHGLTFDSARKQDAAREYAVIPDEHANAGLIVYAKFGDKWEPNPWSSRFVIRELLDQLNIKLPPIHQSQTQDDE